MMGTIEWCTGISFDPPNNLFVKAQYMLQGNQDFSRVVIILALTLAKCTFLMIYIYLVVGQ